MIPRDPLTRQLAKLRDIEPDAALHERLESALRAAEREERKGASRVDARHRLGRLMLVVPALASTAVALHLVVSEPDFDVARTAEHALELPSVGEAALDLDLLLDGHDVAFASVRVHAPHGVSVHSSSGVDLPSPSCHDSGCVYEFMHPTSDDPPVRVRVRRPGRYRVQVEHASDGHRVQEVVVLHARR